MTGGREIPGHGPGGETQPRKDLLYFQERAEQEIRRAELADHPDAARAHFLLAGFYLDLVHNPSEAPGQPRGVEETEPPTGDRTGLGAGYVRGRHLARNAPVPGPVRNSKG